MFNICVTLKYSLVTPTTKSYKWLDCNYNDGNFMFSVYTDDIPNTTRNLVVGDFKAYTGSNRQCFLLSNSAIAQSQVSYADTYSGFVLEDKYGLGRETRCVDLYNTAYTTMKNLREAVARYKAAIAAKEIEENNQLSAISSKKAEIAKKQQDLDALATNRRSIQHQIVQIQNEIDDTRQDIEDTQALIDVETDPQRLARLILIRDRAIQNLQDLQDDMNDMLDQIQDLNDTEYTWNQQKQNLEDQLSTLEQGLASISQAIADLEDDFDDAEKAWCIGNNSAYLTLIDKAINAEATSTDYIPTKKDIAAEKYDLDYESYFFAGLRLDVDYDKDGDDEYCVKYDANGQEEYYALRWHVNKQYLKIWILPVLGSLTVQRQAAWEYQLGHLTYEEYEQEEAPNYSTQQDLTKHSYEVADTKRNTFKTFEFFKRSGYGGYSVNYNNNLSQLMPIVWYVQRDDEQINQWSAVGQSDVIKYVNMYNMGTGRLLQPQYPKPQNRYANYYLWRRRPRWTDWVPEANNTADSVTSIFGFGGYPGIGFMLEEVD